MNLDIREEQKATSYLLGELPEQEQSAIEEKFFADPEYSDFVQLDFIQFLKFEKERQAE
jgi:hypothetical protein